MRQFLQESVPITIYRLASAAAQGLMHTNGLLMELSARVPTAFGSFVGISGRSWGIVAST